MSKTAEEILKAHEPWIFDKDLGMQPPDNALAAMHEFAAQEIESYKERLKEAFIARYGHIGSYGAHETIDTVK